MFFFGLHSTVRLANGEGLYFSGVTGFTFFLSGISGFDEKKYGISVFENLTVTVI